VIAFGDKYNKDCEYNATDYCAANALQGIHRLILRGFLDYWISFDACRE
jgi:hypothetical protein